MKNIPERCERCGAPINWDGISTEIDCSYCGKKYIANDTLLTAKARFRKISKEASNIKDKLIEQSNNINQEIDPLINFKKNVNPRPKLEGSFSQRFKASLKPTRDNFIEDSDKEENRSSNAPSNLQRFIWSLSSKNNKDSLENSTEKSSNSLKSKVSIIGLTILGLISFIVIYKNFNKSTNWETKILDECIDKYNSYDWHGVVEKCTEAIQNDPTDLYSGNAFAYSLIGDAQEELGNHKLAISSYTKAIFINSEDQYAYHGRAYSKESIDDNKGAIRDYTIAIGFDPNDDIAYGNRGWSRYKIGDYKGAIEDSNKSISIKDNEGYVYHNRGLSRYELGFKKAACLDIFKAKSLKEKEAIDYLKAGNNQGDWCREMPLIKAQTYKWTLYDSNKEVDSYVKLGGWRVSKKIRDFYIDIRSLDGSRMSEMKYQADCHDWSIMFNNNRSFNYWEKVEPTTREDILLSMVCRDKF